MQHTSKISEKIIYIKKNVTNITAMMILDKLQDCTKYAQSYL